MPVSRRIYHSMCTEWVCIQWEVHPIFSVVTVTPDLSCSNVSRTGRRNRRSSECKGTLSRQQQNWGDCPDEHLCKFVTEQTSLTRRICLTAFIEKLAVRGWSTVFPDRVLARRKTQSWEQDTESIVAICFRPYLNHAIWHCILLGETRFHVEFGILWCQHGSPKHIQVYIRRSGEIHWWHLLGTFYRSFLKSDIKFTDRTSNGREWITQ